MSRLLDVRGVHAGYTDANILHGVDLHVYAGEVVTIVGPNGAGKSTVLKVVMGLLAAREGRITLDGEDLIGRKTETMLDLGVGYVPQVSNVFPSLTVMENLRIGKRTADSATRMHEVFTYFPILSTRRSVRAGRLSGGERQMLALGRALMRDPKILLLDEPSAALSPGLTREVFDKILEINANGTAILLVEQNARQSLEFSDRAYVLDTGRTAMTGTGPELLADPKMAELYLGGHARTQGGRTPSDT